jgi:SAM-dependent methyltransferase
MSVARTVKSLVRQMGVDPVQAVRSLRSVPSYLRNYRAFKRDLERTGQPFSISSLHPSLGDRFDAAGSIPLHYFFMDLHVARLVHRNNPSHHIDVGSRLDGFVSMVASFREIEVFDIRPLSARVPNVTFTRADLTGAGFPLREYCDSLSCLHALEHFGLGRYGDPVDARGHLKGLENMHALLKPGGTFYLATVIGPQRIEFDAHRVFSLGYLRSLLDERYELVSFAYVDDSNAYHPGHALSEEDISRNLGCTYGCGIYELRKK